MLTSLRHGAVGCGNNQDSSVHLRRAGDHVLHIIGMARTVDVGIVTLVGLVLHVGGGDGDTALTLFRCIVDLVESLELGLSLTGKNLGDRRGESCLTVVNMPDGSDVYMRLIPGKFCLCHGLSPPDQPFTLAIISSDTDLGACS